MTSIFSLLATWLLFVFVRLSIVWNGRKQGCDSFYFLLTAEVFRAQRKIPVVLPPYYLADIDEQWYPPGFTIFLGLLPEGLVARWHWLVNHVLDACCLLVLDVAMWAAGVPVAAMAAANVVYALTPCLTVEFRALTSRSLGNLLNTLFMLGLYLSLDEPLLASLPLAAWIAILFTHKLTMQLGLVAGPVLSLVFQSWVPVAVTWGGVGLALAVFPRLYWKILKGHWDIVSFWHKEFHNLGAHQVDDSLIYGTPRSPELSLSWRSVIVRNLTVGAQNPFVIVLPVLTAMVLISGGESGGALRGMFGTVLDWEFGNWLLAWAWVTFGWSWPVANCMSLRAVGEGLKYMKYLSFPVAILALCGGWAPLAAGGIASLYLLVRNYRSLRGSDSVAMQRCDDALGDLIDYLRAHPEVDRLGCLNLHMADPIVYQARKKVLWGTHHYMFNELALDFFPVLRMSPAELTAKYGLEHWIVNTNYVNPGDIGFEGCEPVETFGQYAVYRAADCGLA